MDHLEAKLRPVASSFATMDQRTARLKGTFWTTLGTFLFRFESVCRGSLAQGAPRKRSHGSPKPIPCNPVSVIYVQVFDLRTVHLLQLVFDLCALYSLLHTFNGFIRSNVQFWSLVHATLSCLKSWSCRVGKMLQRHQPSLLISMPMQMIKLYHWWCLIISWLVVAVVVRV